MSTLKEKLQQEWKDLERLRDEVKLQAKLGEAEAKKKWDEAQGRWPEIEEKFREFESRVDEASGEAVQRTIRATRDLYEDIRRRFSKGS